MAMKDKKLHIVTEWLGAGLGIYLIWLSTQSFIPTVPISDIIQVSHSQILLISGVVGLVVDGYMVTTW